MGSTPTAPLSFGTHIFFMSDTILTATPGQSLTITESGIPAGATVGFQIVRALSNLTAQAWSTTGVVQRPAGSGNFVIPFVAPVDGDLYLVVVDWTGGTLVPETTRVTELQVLASVVSSPTGLGEIADYARSFLGGETWAGLLESPNYGESDIVRVVDSIKAIFLTVPPATADEDTLPKLGLVYLGKQVALALLPPARDYWGNQIQSKALGNDPQEIATYPNRNTMLDALKVDLVASIAAMQEKALEALGTVLLTTDSVGPDIDEDDDDLRTTEDPRVFPRANTFPYDDDVSWRIRGGVLI